MNIPSLSEITARISALVDRWNRRENQLIAFLSQPEGEVTVTDGLERDHRIPSLRSLIQRVTGMTDALSGESAKTQAHVSAALSLRNEAQEAAQSASGSAEAAQGNAEAVSTARGQVNEALQEVRASSESLSNAAASATASSASALEHKQSAAEAAQSAQASAEQATSRESAATAAASSARTSAQTANTAKTSAQAAQQQAQDAATAAQAYKGAAQAASAEAVASKQSAAASATSASQSATSAQQAKHDAAVSAASAETHRQAASGHEQNAWHWAVGQAVGGSAKYWAEQAQAAASGALTYQGAWQADTGTYPTNPRKGHFYRVSSAGTFGGVQYRVGDQIIYNGQTWDHVDNTDSVTSVAGRVGDVVLTRHDIHGLGALASENSVDYGSQVHNKPDLAPRVHTHSFNEITGKPAAYPPSPHRHAWGDLDAIPVTASRWPSVPEVSGLTSALSAKLSMVNGTGGLHLPPDANLIGSAIGAMRAEGLNTPDGDWTQIISARNEDLRFGFQLALPWNAGGLYLRHIRAGEYKPWVRLWDTGTFNPDTKLDASVFHWNHLPGKPALAAQFHGHAIADVTGLQDALNARLSAQLFHWNHLPGKPALATSDHRHTVADVQGLQDALNGKAPYRAELGTTCRTPVSWDAALDNGWYRGAGLPGAPQGDWIMGQVASHNTDWVRQDVYPFSNGDVYTRYVRYKRNGGWLPWYKIRDSAHRVVVSAHMPTSDVVDGDIWIAP